MTKLEIVEKIAYGEESRTQLRRGPAVLATTARLSVLTRRTEDTI